MNTQHVRFVAAATLAATLIVGLLAQSATPPGHAPGQPDGTTTWARGVEGQRKADLGNGTYLNPVMAGDHPDPSVLKDGSDYYLTFSSFDAYPGLVIWHSRDLVNWEPIGPALFRNVGSVWAPDLVKHMGRYYIYFPGIGPGGGERSNWVIWADNIRGPWSEPIDLKLGRIDPDTRLVPTANDTCSSAAATGCRSPTMGCR
jgi:xylan 1,4-beta-xylosidase